MMLKVKCISKKFETSAKPQKPYLCSVRIVGYYTWLVIRGLRFESVTELLSPCGAKETFTCWWLCISTPWLTVHSRNSQSPWRSGRIGWCTGLENRRVHNMALGVRVPPSPRHSTTQKWVPHLRLVNVATYVGSGAEDTFQKILHLLLSTDKALAMRIFKACRRVNDKLLTFKVNRDNVQPISGQNLMITSKSI